MALPSVYDLKTTEQLLNRIEKLTPQTKPLWGKMDVAKMLAHINVSYGLESGAITNKKPSFFMKFILKMVIKPIIVGEKEYKKNAQTAPVFVIKSDKDFDIEKNNLINNIKSTQQKGASYYEGKFNNSFGNLTFFSKLMIYYFNRLNF